MRRNLCPALLAITFGLANHALAQTPTGPPERSRARVEATLLEGITLSPAQRARVDSITASYRGRYPERSPESPPSEADRTKFRALAQEQQKAIRAILTAEQQPIFDQNVAKMRERMRARMQGGPPPAQ
jgi:Spy/CpxP family protein refolding chaperone